MGDLPQYWGTTELLDFFCREFGNAVEARVIGSQVSGAQQGGHSTRCTPWGIQLAAFAGMPVAVSRCTFLHSRRLPLPGCRSATVL